MAMMIRRWSGVAKEKYSRVELYRHLRLLLTSSSAGVPQTALGESPAGAERTDDSRRARPERLPGVRCGQILSDCRAHVGEVAV